MATRDPWEVEILGPNPSAPICVHCGRPARFQMCQGCIDKAVAECDDPLRAILQCFEGERRGRPIG